MKKAGQILRRDGVSELFRRSRNYLSQRPCRWATQGNRMYYEWRVGEYNTQGIDVFEEDWDNLIILDACRFDTFAKVNTLPGELQSRISRGSTTWEFLKGNFTDKQLHDTVYVTDNPWYIWMSEEIGSELHESMSLKRTRFDGAVTDAETMTDRAINFAQEHTDKRVIAHYLQPHSPFFSENGDELFELPSGCMDGVKRSNYSPSDIEAAYDSNLRYVLNHIPKLLDELTGKTVITADHGELLGERMSPIPIRRFEHPEGIYVDELVKVPWFVVDYSERKDIIDDRPVSSKENVGKDRSEELLKSLGYL